MTQPSRVLSSQVTAILAIVALIVGAALGYSAAPVNTLTTTTTTTITQTNAVTTIQYSSSTTITATDSCGTLSSLATLVIPVGFEPTVSYQGTWSVNIATFAAQSDNASALSYVCTYDGNGTTTFYVPLANYLGGWNTLVVAGHKSGSNGTLTLSASMGNQTATESTSQPYGRVVLTLSWYYGD